MPLHLSLLRLLSRPRQSPLSYPRNLRHLLERYPQRQQPSHLRPQPFSSSTLGAREQSRSQPQSSPEGSSTPEAKPEGLPAPDAGIQLDVSGEGSSVSLGHLGPLVVNRDGTVGRVSNWEGMTASEKETTLALLRKRNQARLDALKKEDGENGGEKP